MNDDLGVGLRPEHVPFALQLGTQLAVVVDLAVEDDADLTRLVVDGLNAGREIDDAEPRRAEVIAPARMVPGAIGAAVPQRGGHSLNVLGTVSNPDRAGDAAHGGFTSSSPCSRCTRRNGPVPLPLE